MRRPAAVLAVSFLLVACGSKQQPSVAPSDDAPQATQSPLVSACQAGTARSCLLAANDAEAAGDIEAAAQLYQSACDLEEAAGCALAGGLLAEAGSLERASAAFSTGCDLEDATSCYGQGLIVAGSFGGEPDAAAAAPLFRRSCDLGLAAACGDLAGLYRSGEGVPLDLVQADALRTRACDGGDGESCMHLGLRAWQREDRDAARSLFERSCVNELPDPTGCGYFGWIIWSDAESADPARGIALMDSSCEAGAALGCALRAASHASMGDTESGEAALERACELDAESCERFSANYKAALETQ